MKTYTFTILGNQEKKDGNPIPYFRTTQNSLFNKGSKRYQAWKDYVRKVFFEEMKGKLSRNELNDLNVTEFRKKKPIELLPDEEAEMLVDIFWRDDAHADGDNIFKGIADALFVNDKKLWYGRFKSIPSGDKKGRVEVMIKITKKVKNEVGESKNG